MRRFQSVICLTVLIIVLQPSRQLFAQDETAWLLSQINCLRQSLGAPPLTLNVALTSAATEHSVDLSTHPLKDFHVGFDGSTPTMRANSFGYTGSVGENVAWGRVANDAFTFWLGSQVHYTNMTNEHWKDIGIGIGSNGQGTWYTLVFGATNWNVDPFTASPCTASDQSLPVLIQSTASSSFPIGIQQTPTQTPVRETPTQGPPTPTVMSVDENGFIQHVIQPGETPGRVILMYGYAWEDLPRIMALNNMTEAEATRLNIGDIFLIPPKEGDVIATSDVSDGIVLAVASDTPSLKPTSTFTATALPPSVTSTLLPTATITETPTLSVSPASTVQPPTATILPSPVATVIVPTASEVSSVSVSLPTETLIPPVAFVASPTPVLIAEVAAAPTDNTASILIGVVVVQQIIMFGMIGVWRINRWRDSL